MNIKKLLSLLLALIMCATLFAACSSPEPAAEAPAKDAAPEAVAEVPADAEDDEDDEAVEETKHIIVECFTLASFDTAVVEEISAAVNELIEPLINVNVTLHMSGPGSIATPVTVGIPAGDQIDLYCYSPVPSCGIATMNAQNQVIDMRPYLEEYAPETLAMLGDFVKASTFDGKLAGIPIYREWNEGFWLTMNRDVLDQLGLTEQAEACASWTEYEAIMQAVVDNTDLAGIGPNDGNGSIVQNYAFFVGEENWSDSFCFDNLGDQYSFIACDSETDTVYSYYASEDYKNAVTMAHDWYQKGLVFKDAATTEQTRNAQLAGNLSFSISGQGTSDNPVSKAAGCKCNVLCKELAPGMIGNSNLVKFGWCMPVTCKEPEAAAKFLELMYTNADLANLLSWGIEGRDWVLKDGEACYPDGVDVSTVRYHNDPTNFGNYFIAYPWQGLGADFCEKSLAKLKAAPVTKYLGLSVDTSSVADEITACYNVEEQYRAAMNCGQLDPAVELPKFLEALEKAGIQKILDCYQSQLDAFVAANG